jgi:hypothetical protein
VAAALWLVWLAPEAARGVEPVTVTVEGAAEIDEGAPGRARERAFQAALVEATMAVALRLLTDDAMGVDQSQLRQGLSEGAAAAILTYRIEDELGERRSAEDPSVREFALRLTATVDAEQVRSQLDALGLGRPSSSRPSVLVHAAGPAGEGAIAQASLTRIEHYVKQRLAGAGFAVVEPALRASQRTGPGLLELARGVGADLAVDLSLSWKDQAIATGITGGVLEAEARALRVGDGAQMASARFQAPSYHADPREAQARAVDAVQEQIGDNLLLQLERNWEALEGGARALRVVLANVGSFAQVQAVQERLQGAPGAQAVELAAMGPRSAELVVRGSLSAGALQERLVSAVFEDFRLEPVDLEADRVGVRVAAARDPGTRPPAAR